MEQKLYNLYNKIISNRIYSVITSIVFPMAIIVMSLVNVHRGIDLTDSTYSLSNAKYLEQLDSSWFFPIFYSNLFLRILMALPGGSTLLGMNIYASIVKCLIALAAYYFFIDVMKFDRFLTFASEIVALGLCWCPVSIAYNYLTNLLFFGGVALIFTALKKSDNKYLFIAGFMLGTNFFVRFPNIVETGLILVVWADSLLNREKFAVWGRKTLLCIGGFFAAFIPAVILVIATRGVSEYFAGIGDLFVMTDTNSAYSGMGMIASIVKAYIHAWSWLELVILAELLVLLGSLVFPAKLSFFRYVVSGIATLGLLAVLYKKALFSFDYNSYSSIYGLGKIVVCLAIILFVVVLFVKSESNENKLLAFASLIIIAISPLGTNNEVYANLNNMFWVLPVFVYLLCRFVSTNEYIRGVRFSLLILVMALAFQSFMFGITFKFRDGNDGAMNTKVFGNDVLFGMRTTESNAKMLSDLSEIWSANSYAEGTVLLYGNVCGFGYVFSTQPAISSPWPSLPSYLQTTFEKEMQGLSDKISNGSITAPVIVIGEEELEGILSGTGAKQEILKNFLEKYNYSEIYNCEKLSVYAVK